MKFTEMQNKVESNSAEIAELKKAMALSTDAPDSMQIKYTDELKSKVFEQAPFLRFLESKNRIMDSSSSRVGFYIENNGASASFIAEGDDIPAASATKYTEVVKSMTTLVNPIFVSMMAQQGNEYIDLLQRETDKGFINLQNKTDSALLQGKGTSNDFKGFTSEVTTNTADMAGAAITESAIDDMLTKIIDGNGGNVDCIVTSNAVAKQLKTITAPYRRYNDKVDIGLGHRVTTYESLNGSEIPILIDSNLEKVDGKDSMLFVDSSTIEVKYLMRPTVLTDLPTNKLGYSQCVASFVTAANIAEFMNGIITGISLPTA